MYDLRISKEVFTEFLTTVVKGGVFSEEERGRDFRPHTDAEKCRLQKGGIDPRPPKLMRVSGKGGYVDGPDFSRRKKFRNVTLLDHAVSVTRGALVFAEIDLRASGLRSNDLPSRLAVIAATAFLHDADKMLEMSREEGIEVSHIETLVARFNVGSFLGKYSVSIDPADLLQRIQAVEITRIDKIIHGSRLLNQSEINDSIYVRLADRLDGAFLHEDKGVEGVVRELDAFRGLRSDALRQGWRSSRILSPHTPFLLDKVQEAFAGAVIKRSGIPPLIETHHDGELFLVAPEKVFDRALEDAIAALAGVLSRGLRVDVNPRGTRDLLDGGKTYEDLQKALCCDQITAEKALFVHVDVLNAQSQALMETFDAQGFGPRLDQLDQFSGKHFSCWPMVGDEDPHVTGIRNMAAAFAVALSCAAPRDRKLAICVPDSMVREGELTTVLSEESIPPPEWIMDVEHDLSRHTLLAVHAACFCIHDENLRMRLIGQRGVVRVWLEGYEGRAGLFKKVGDPGRELADAAGRWLRVATSKAFEVCDEDHHDGRCHFTATPMNASSSIDNKTGLYGINVSAFSGREGRPEFHDRIRASTLVSAPIAAEYRLRALEMGRTKGVVPVLVSSPGNAGLFASLKIRVTPSIDRYSLYDIMRLESKARQKLYIDYECYESRTTIGRYDALPQRMAGTGNTPGLISFVKIVIDSAMRTGRAIHVFRGLPVQTNAFVAFDCLTNQLAQAIGGAELRLEQLPFASKILRQIESIIQTSGLGLDMALRIIDPVTRFGAACEALTIIDRLNEADRKRLGSLSSYLLQIARNQTMQTNPHDSVVVEFAKAIARIQAAPSRNSSNNEKILGMRIALTQIDDASRIGQTSKESLVAAIVTGLENEFERSGRLEWRGKKFNLPFPTRKAREAAEVFVDRVWPHAFDCRSPASRERRIATAIYRTAFETASYTKQDTVDSDSSVPETIVSE